MFPAAVVLLAIVFGAPAPVSAQQAPARISEERISLATYPFSEPNRIPILANDPRLYPYHRFEGYTHEPVSREWTVLHLENEWIELWVLPEVGGKVWGARVKETGHEFIYRNEVLKFRNIALRGPWTSGGIEFNFGVIGHTPSTATPVDYLTRENEDGSVSAFVGSTDLPSRTRWRVEIRLPADRAYFETNAQWHNPTPLEQPYYNWMTGAAFARPDLVMSIPGTAYLGHPGEEHAWPVDAEGRHLPVYDENRFGGNKSYHVVGELEDHFGGYYRDDDYGFGHWAPYEDMPGQKLWLWALSREGGIWEDLLTDTDGQYVEFQAGRLLVQYTPTDAVNPISQVGFDPGGFDRWSETWFPLEGLGGLTDASRDGALFVERLGGRTVIHAEAFRAGSDTLRVRVAGTETRVAVDFEPLAPFTHEIVADDSAAVRVELPALGLTFDSDPTALALDRPFATDSEAVPSIPPVLHTVTEARQLVLGRRLGEARPLYASALAEEPWNRDALLGMADLEYRRGRYEEGLELARRALQLDGYDAEANFVAGNLYRALGRDVDARESFGWAARVTAFRTAAHLQLAELALERDDLADARRHAELAADHDRLNPSVHRLLAVLARRSGDAEEAGRALERLGAIDPLDPFMAAERWLAAERSGAAGTATSHALAERLRGENPQQDLLELVVTYARWGLRDDAAALSAAVPDIADDPLLRAWRASLTADTTILAGGADPTLVFPYRAETLPVIRDAASRDEHWSWTYLLALNLWARDRAVEAAALMVELGDRPDFAPFYAARAALGGRLRRGERLAVADTTDPAGAIDREVDLRRAVELDPGDRVLRVPLIRFLQAEGRWEDALTASGEARRAFPGNFDLDLLHVTSLVATMRFAPAIEILDAIAVLPSENAAAAHRLFAEAHTQAGLAALELRDPGLAAEHFRTATTWPERLGQGRPYEPEERLQRYLLGVALARSGDDAAARAELEAVVTATPPAALSGGVVAPLDLLAALALDGLGRARSLEAFGDGQEGALARIVVAVRSAASAGGDVPAALRTALAGAMQPFADVEGRLLYRALVIE